MIVSMPKILGPAFRKRYGVLAINIVDPLNMGAVLAAAEEVRSPVIIQVSVKTIKFWEQFVSDGAQFLQETFAAMARNLPAVPTTLHLDHCPDRAVITQCLKAGWNSVLFDGSKLGFEECLNQTKEVVEEAYLVSAHVEGEVEPILGAEDGIESGSAPAISVADATRFIRETGVYSFTPAIGTVHGRHQGKLNLRYDRVEEIVLANPETPLVLHGGTGLSKIQFRRLTKLGAAKVNISTKNKEEMIESYARVAAGLVLKPDPLKLFTSVAEDTQSMVVEFMHTFGSVGRAW